METNTTTTNGNGLALDGAVFNAYRIEKFQPTPRHVVHVKPSNLGDYTVKGDKAIPVVVVAAYRDELIVELSTPFVIHGGAAFKFRAVRVAETKEGHRLVRTVLAAVKLIARLGREGARKRATAEQLAARAAGRQGREGTCQICEGLQIVKKGNLVLHGYERPGHGYITGSCYGVNHLPFEVSCDALKSYIVMLDGIRANIAASLAGLADRTEILVTSTLRGGKSQIVKLGDASFERAIAAKRYELESSLANITRDIARQSARVAAWKPAA